jgi:hypothetical protein
MASAGCLQCRDRRRSSWPWMMSHSGIDLITFTRSTNIGKPVLESAAGTLEPVTLELRGNHSRAVVDPDPEKIALFGSIALVPVNWNPGRYGLASTLFAILSFRPVRMRTQRDPIPGHRKRLGRAWQHINLPGENDFSGEKLRSSVGIKPPKLAA